MRHRPSPYCIPIGLAAFLAATPTTASAQSCSWGAAATMTAPLATSLGSDQAHLQTPSRLAVDAGGNVYVADPRAGRVFVRDAWGRLLSVRQGLAQPLAVAVDAFGFIYVGEAGTGSVSVFGPWWDLRFRFGQGEGEFSVPNHIAVDPDPSFPRIYVADSGANAVKVYSNAGGLLFQFGQKGAGTGQFDFPAGIHVSQAGEIFVADQNNDRVQVFDRTGAFLRCFGGTAATQRFGRIQGITGDGVGRLYVADAFQGSIWVFEPGGAPLGTVGSFGEGPAELTGVGGIAIDGRNRLLVASGGSGRVASYGLDAYEDPRAIHATVGFLPVKTATRWKTLQIHPRWGRAPVDPWKTAMIEIRQGQLDQVRPESIVANGVRAFKSTVGDRDLNGVPEITAYFEREALVATFPDDAWATGEGFVGLAGEFFDGTLFEATGVLDLRNEVRGMRKEEVLRVEKQVAPANPGAKAPRPVGKLGKGRREGARREQHQ